MKKVYLVGAGPGDPGLLTIKGMECIRKANVVVYDRLVHPSILKYVPSDAEMIYVGKISSDHTMRQEEINQLLVDKAMEDKIVVRLKGGDPFIFGRGGEEAEVLVANGIKFEIVPGISSAVAVPAYAGIPVTHRGLCSTLGIITGHEDPGKTTSSIKWDKISTGIDTLVFLMGVENLSNIVANLINNGRDPSSPIALVRWGTRAEQETISGTLANIVDKVRLQGFKSPAVTVVGDVVNLREKLRWFDNRPLSGLKILVTRSREQSSTLSDILREYGAEPIEFPVIKISPPEDYIELDRSLESIENYDWILFASANAVLSTIKRLQQLGGDVRWLKGPKIGAIGPKTSEALETLGIKVDFTPTVFMAETMIQEFPENLSGKKILLPRAKEGREIIIEKITEKGAIIDVVTAYQTQIEDSDATSIQGLLRDKEIDIITFTSSSTVRNFVQLIGNYKQEPDGPKIACIGPITAQTATEYGMIPDIIAAENTIESLASVIAETF